MSGWWSVTTVKCGRPARKTLHLVMAHATARHIGSLGLIRSEILLGPGTMYCLSYVARP